MKEKSSLFVVVSSFLAATIVLILLFRGGQDGENKTLTFNGVDIEFVFVSSGTFVMGDQSLRDVLNDLGLSGLDGLGEVERQVTLTNGFWISKFPITQRQFEAVMGENPSYFADKPNHPVETVSWHDASAFAQAIGGRLPTEAQWEFAARGGSLSRNFIYSGSNNINKVAYFLGNRPTASTQAVGRKVANELGIFDLSGNVWEWTNDWWENFNETATANPIGPSSGTSKVMRGGSWDSGAQFCRVAKRGSNWPDVRDNIIGFRVVL